jgi:hypothetical protein
MDLNIPLLIKYIGKNGTTATVNISITSSDPILIFVLGDNHEGPRREFLYFTTLDEILIENNIVGKNPGDPSQVQSLLDLPRGHKDWPSKHEKIEELIYNTLAKYIIQLLHAGTGDVYFPSIKPLPQHKTFFTERK